ncbi:MAG TPA: HAMP domain-containing sensor histidine kinase, partial [Anaerovoracaceae bacterium]|nr:HAMP domain-containing sensor histidine kinase [Anaerovoracaceae bacterium]
MKGKIANRFLINYVLMLFISILITFMVFALTDFANDLINKNLMKNNYTAEQLMKDDYKLINYDAVLENGGGIQIINSGLEIVLSEGIDPFGENNLSVAEWTEFLTKSKAVGVPYSFDIAYNTEGDYWIVVTFPTSIRIDLDIAHNELYPSKDMESVRGFIVAVVLFYLLSLAAVTVIYSRITSIGFVDPLKKLYQSAKRLGEGDYSARVKVKTKNEIAELGQIFNTMAEKIEKEIALRELSEENRKRLILDISHDLKNPLAGMMGYAELCLKDPDLPEEKQKEYIKVIYDNCIRVNGLINDLFEFSKLESSEYKIEPAQIDLSEYLREEISVLLPMLDSAGFSYDFNIPEEELYASFDPKEMRRVLHNLIVNSLQYNREGTTITITAEQNEQEIRINIQDNGIGMSEETAEHIFEAFVRGDRSRNSKSGGTGLGLSIAEKIMKAHGGSIELKTAENKGCEFILHFPKKES